MKEMSMIKPGYLLKNILEGVDSSPVNQRKRWTESERKKLKKRFLEIYKKLNHKRETIRLLETEFGRGYFSILNQIEKMSSFKKTKKK